MAVVILYGLALGWKGIYSFVILDANSFLHAKIFNFLRPNDLGFGSLDLESLYNYQRM